jgi:hypothetical protein
MFELFNGGPSDIEATTTASSFATLRAWPRRPLEFAPAGSRKKRKGIRGSRLRRSPVVARGLCGGAAWAC